MAQTREEMIKDICGRKPKHRIINTSFGEVKLVGGFNYSTQEHFCEVYIGDNFDQYVCEIDCNILDDKERNFYKNIHPDVRKVNEIVGIVIEKFGL